MTRRRGRPFRLPEDTSSLRTVHGGVDLRIAWLLALHRIHAADPEMAHREHFVAALNNLGVAADQARVSRWESGNHRVPDRVIVAYEQVLGLTPGRISATATGLRRSLEPDTVTTEVVPAVPGAMHQELDDLFDKVYDGGRAPHWLALTNYLAVRPTIYLRQDTWTDLAERLIGQTNRSTGCAFISRYESLRTLVRHPGAQRHVMRAIGGFVTDPDAQSVRHPLTLLQEVEHPGANDLVLRLLGTSTGMLQQGAAWAASAKAARGHYDEDGLRQLESLVLLLLAAGPRATSEVDILDVAARLPDFAVQRTRRAIRDSEALPRLDLMLHSGEVLPHEITRHVANRLATAVEERTERPYRIEPDQMLQRLLREALFHGHQERAHQAAVALTASPYRGAVAEACADLAEHGDEAVAVRAVGLLRYLATEAQRPQLVAWAADQRRPQVRRTALIALGRLPQGLGPEEERVVMSTLATTDTAPTRRAALYALGMAGSDRLEDLLASEDDLHRRAATWWTRTGPALHERSQPCGQAG